MEADPTDDIQYRILISRSALGVRDAAVDPRNLVALLSYTTGYLRKRAQASWCVVLPHPPKVNADTAFFLAQLKREHGSDY